MIYTVTFNPALDYVVKVEHFTLGSVNRTIRENIFYGGKGINVSALLANLGYRSTASVSYTHLTLPTICSV